MDKKDLKSHPEVRDGEAKLTGGIVNKIEEYFQLKKSLKGYNADLKDLLTQHLDYGELLQAREVVKRLTMKIKEDEDISMVMEKVEEVKERVDLLKELIRIEMIEDDTDEVTNEGRKLKLISILKELKNEDSTYTKKRNRVHPDQMGFKEANFL